MKSVPFFIFILFACYAVSAQAPVNTGSAGLNRDRGKAKARTWIDTGMLKTNEFDEFSYSAYLVEKDSLNRSYMIDYFRKRLIAIDSTIAANPGVALDIPELSFNITYTDDGSVDTFAVYLTDSRKFSESDNFEPVVQDQNLTTLQSVLGKAKYADRRVTVVQALQVDKVARHFEELQRDANYDKALYAEALLTYIHQLLADNKTKLGISNDNIYKISFEPANLAADERIGRREKFIRYVYTKITD